MSDVTRPDSPGQFTVGLALGAAVPLLAVAFAFVTGAGAVAGWLAFLALTAGAVVPPVTGGRLAGRLAGIAAGIVGIAAVMYGALYAFMANADI